MSWIEVTNARGSKYSVQIAHIRSIASDGSGGGCLTYQTGQDANVQESYEDLKRSINTALLHDAQWRAAV